MDGQILSDNFIGCEVAAESHGACMAKSATHGTADLGGDAQGKSAVGGNGDTFDTLTVSKT